MTITRLQLLTNDLKATAAFYTEITGLAIISQTDTSITFAAGSTELSFHHSDIPQPVYHFAFTIPANKLQEALQDMKRRTEILSLPDGSSVADFSRWNAEAFYFYDNNGNILEYITRRDLGNAEEQLFSGSRICCISEAGLVTTDVPALAAQFLESYGIPLFARQPPEDTFTVMGDNNGLLILAARGRHWYPTSVAAEVFPVTVWFKEGNGSVQEYAITWKQTGA